MIQLYDGGVYLVNGKDIVPEQEAAKVQQLTGKTVSKEDAKKGTIAYSILKNHFPYLYTNIFQKYSYIEFSKK